MRRLVPAIALLLAAPGSARAFGPPVTAAEAQFRFVVVNDLHCTDADLVGSRAQVRRAVDEINGFASQIDFVLVAGDLGQAADLASLAIELRVVREELDRLAVPMHVAIGNHDVTTFGDDSAWRALFGPTSYSFEHQGVRFVAFNTVGTRTSTTISANALDSLSLQLAAIPATTPLVVFAHHPLGPITPFAATNRQEFYNRVAGHDLRAVFSGHYHGNFEEERDGVWYCTTRALSEHRVNHDGAASKGYRLVSVWPDGSMSSEYFSLGDPPRFEPEGPAWVGTGNRLAVVGRTLRLDLRAHDNEGEAISYAALGMPAGANFDVGLRQFTWTPGTAQVGLHTSARFVATTAHGSDTLALTVRVLPSACAIENFAATPTDWTTSGGAWAAQNGVMVQSLAGSGATAFVAPGSFSDCYIEADMVHDQGVGYVGLVFRYLDANNYYYVWNNSSKIEVRRRVNGVASRIGAPVPVGAVSGWHHVRVEALGSLLRVFWDGALAFEATDSTFPSGRAGLLCSQASARFDDFIAVGCAGLYDRPPALAPIGAVTAVAGAPLVIPVSASDPDGHALSMSVTGLPPGATFDSVARRITWSPQPSHRGLWRGAVVRASDGELFDAETIAITVLDTTDACLYETFDDAAAASKWNPAGGTWAVTGGVYAGSATSTSVSLHGTANFANFVYQARVRIEGSGSGNLVFRALDSSRYYFLHVNASDELELRKQRGAIVTTLAGEGDFLGGARDLWHLVRVEAEDQVLRVFVDGERRFEVRDLDEPYLAGRVGFRVSSATVRVDDVLVESCGATTSDAAPGPALLHLQVAPNPFNPRTTASFDLAQSSHVRVVLYDVAGHLLRQLHNDSLAAGRHHIVWDGADAAGRGVASGIYYLRIETPDATLTRNLVLVR